MLKCPRNYAKKVCRGPRGYYDGYVDDNGVVMCRVTEFALSKNLVQVANLLSIPDKFKCSGCSVREKE